MHLYEFLTIVKHLYTSHVVPLRCPFLTMLSSDIPQLKSANIFFFNRGIVIFYLVWLILNMLTIKFKELFSPACKSNRTKKKHWLHSAHVHGRNIEWNLATRSSFVPKTIENWTNTVQNIYNKYFWLSKMGCAAHFSCLRELKGGLSKSQAVRRKIH